MDAKDELIALAKSSLADRAAFTAKHASSADLPPNFHEVMASADALDLAVLDHLGSEHGGSGG